MSFKALTLNTPPAQAAHILAEDDAAIYEALLGGDRVLDIGNKLTATVITNNSVRISDGVAVVSGHVGRIVKGDYEDMTIENGASGKKRNDLICARFIVNGDTDTYKLVVVKGAAGTTATDPTIVQGDLYAGDNQRDFPLWRVVLDGLSIVRVEQLYTVSKTVKGLEDGLDALNRKFQRKLTTTIANSYVDTYFETNATLLSVADGLLNIYVSIKTKADFPKNGLISLALPVSTGLIYQFRAIDSNGKIWSVEISSASMSLFTDNIIPGNTWIRFIASVPF